MKTQQQAPEGIAEKNGQEDQCMRVCGYDISKVYVICAAYYKTGGTEVLHQLVYHINELGGDADIAYINLIDGLPLCHPAFEKYVSGHVSLLKDAEDREDVAVVIPEGYPEYHEQFQKAKKFFWWLSVDNFEGIYQFDENKIEEVFKGFEDSILLHLVQSKYAHEYLTGQGIDDGKIRHLADYLNAQYLDGYKEISFKDRRDIVLYNPKKGIESTTNIISAAPDVEFVALENMTNDQVLALMRQSKLYIDFGNHPGKDRMPREAAMCGCLVLTGRHGSAGFFEDISIPEEYKMDDANTPASEVASKIRECLSEYEDRIADLDYYRNRILMEKQEFKDDINAVFFEERTKNTRLSGRADEIPLYEKIKLIIWDMDETFWKGTLSEESVEIPREHVEFIHNLSKHGIINSISSKNNEDEVMAELEKAGLDEYFVFNDISWDEKGSLIEDKINRMKLRGENVLFIDDNARNLEQAVYHVPGLMTAEPGVIGSLIGFYGGIPESDPDENRLRYYHILEKKDDAAGKAVSKEQFLFDSDIRITVNRNCLEELDRIEELVARTNQLNFTKKRDGKKLLEKLIVNDWNDCAYIKVRDRFGDYGITGFYCFNKREYCMEHFLFSCRILGMGIEQYIYNMLGCPEFEAVPPVASTLIKDRPVPWIKENEEEEIVSDRLLDNRIRILLKGPCDMSAIEPYLSGGSITTEFNYVNRYGFVTTGQNHSMHIYESAVLPKADIDRIIAEVPFIIEGDFETGLFTNEYHVICYSLLQDLQAGLYRNKHTGYYISFSSRNFPLTDPAFHDRFINKEIQGHGFDFTKEILDSFAKDWEYVEEVPVELLLRNLEYIYDHVPGEPVFVLLLGSETDYEGSNEEFDNLVEIYRSINPVIKAFAADHERMRIIDPTDFIHSQDDFEDSINHYSRNVYYEISGRICDHINEAVDMIIKKRSSRI